MSSVNTLLNILVYAHTYLSLFFSLLVWANTSDSAATAPDISWSGCADLSSYEMSTAEKIKK